LISFYVSVVPLLWHVFLKLLFVRLLEDYVVHLFISPLYQPGTLSIIVYGVLLMDTGSADGSCAFVPKPTRAAVLNRPQAGASPTKKIHWKDIQMRRRDLYQTPGT
jgi:hypothetical protein